jgi:hypothetical protein
MLLAAEIQLVDHFEVFRAMNGLQAFQMVLDKP